MVAQIALTTDMYPYSNVLTPNKEKSSSLSKNPSSNINQNTNNSQINQLNNKTNSQNNQINNRNANSSITSETSIKSDQSTQSTSSSSSNPPASIDNFKYKENITLDYTKFSSNFSNIYFFLVFVMIQLVLTMPSVVLVISCIVSMFQFLRTESRVELFSELIIRFYFYIQ